MEKFVEQFRALPERPETMDEAYDLIKTLWNAFQWSLERQGLHSGNSSIPPSQDRLSGRAKDLRCRRKPSIRQRGAQPGHVQHARDLVPEWDVDQLERYFPDAHCACGGEIRIDQAPQHRHQVFDLPEITFTVTEHQRFGGHCQACGCVVSAKLPQEIPTGQMGPGLIAWIALMSGHFRLSTRSIQNLLSLQWGLTFSTGAISESQEPVAEWLEPL